MNLKAGLYRAKGTMYARSYRVIDTQGTRHCIKIVNGPPSPYHGYQKITVSSISSTNDKLLVDATQKELIVESETGFKFEGGREPLWEHADDRFELSDMMKECFSSTDSYSKTKQGPLIAGLILGDSAPAKLIAKSPDAKINVRSGPGLSFDSPSYALVGDEVKANASKWNEDRSALWYQVTFPNQDSSDGLQGWIRSDFVQLRNEPKFNL